MTGADYLYSAASAAGAASYHVHIAAVRAEFKKRVSAMLASDVGNISPEEWFTKYRTTGCQGTYPTDAQTMIDAVGNARSQKYQVGWLWRPNQISYWKAWRAERALGLERKMFEEIGRHGADRDYDDVARHGTIAGRTGGEGEQKQQGGDAHRLDDGRGDGMVTIGFLSS